MEQIYPYFIKFHIIFSVVFLSTALFITVYSAIGWANKKKYGNFENNLRKTYLILLFTDLVLGIILYFFLQKPQEAITAETALKYSNLRFWAIQHFSNVLFVFILSVIGNLFILRSQFEVKKFKYSFVYFGLSTLIIVLSVGWFALRK